MSLPSKDSHPKAEKHDTASGSEENCWEFVIPAVGYPPGWVHIQNKGSGDLLSHTYLHEPPVLLPCPDSLKPSQYREGWLFHWALVNSTGFNPASTVEKNSWCIRNRLTGAILVNNAWDVEKTRLDRVNAWKMGRTGDSTWKLELDTSHNWKITNLESKCLLQQTNVPRNNGTQVICANQVFSLREGTMSWVLRYIHLL